MRGERWKKYHRHAQFLNAYFIFFPTYHSCQDLLEEVLCLVLGHAHLWLCNEREEKRHHPFESQVHEA